MHILQIIVLALVQGLAELLPVSSSAHVIVAEKLMGLDPSSPEMTFLLVMLHTGTMFAVLLFFWKRWKTLITQEGLIFWVKRVLWATVFTGVVGLTLKKIIEKIILQKMLGLPKGEIEHLFGNLALVSTALFCAALLILWSGIKSQKNSEPLSKKLDVTNAGLIGMIQGLCLPFRGFSRSGATISIGLLRGLSKSLCEDFSFALAVVITPPVIAKELFRLLKHSQETLGNSVSITTLITPGLLGMFFSFLSGLFALKWLSSWLEGGKWKFFGYYALVASGFILYLHFTL